MKTAVNHLAPLNLNAQIGLYYPGKPGRLGVQVNTIETLIFYWSYSPTSANTYAALKQDTPEQPIIRAERRRLRDWLSTNLPIQWGKRVQRIEHDDEGVAVYFEDGSSAKGDILIGADGINSVGMFKTP